MAMDPSSKDAWNSQAFRQWGHRNKSLDVCGIFMGNISLIAYLDYIEHIEKSRNILHTVNLLIPVY